MAFNPAAEQARLRSLAAEWDGLIDLHVKGTFFCSQRIGALMLARGYGKIINLSSAWAVSTDDGKSVYCTAKAAIGHMTAALSTEWAPRGVRVNALAPTTTMTDFVKGTMVSRPDRAVQYYCLRAGQLYGAADGK